ncbi:MAG: hypothetical protein K8S56_10205 [Candidatus Cloacimonetes bacterium]|nr:hypothetical protein [Candidatus Cloacimonadota bacterium]
MDKKTLELLREHKRWEKYGRLLAGIIHNLNTPLMGISGRLELLEMKMPEEKSIAQLETQLQRVSEIISSISNVLEKDLDNQSAYTDISQQLLNLDQLLHGNMKYKHRLDVSMKIQPYMMAQINPADLLNAVYGIIEQSVELLQTDDKLSIRGFILDEKGIVEISHILPEVPESWFFIPTKPEEISSDDSRALSLYNIYENLLLCGATLSLEKREKTVCYSFSVPLKQSSFSQQEKTDWDEEADVDEDSSIDIAALLGGKKDDG